MWTQYFKDNTTLQQIDKDVMRTHPDSHFFASDGPGGGEGHRAALRRSLFVHAKLNPRISYVQGMNELLAPLYYCFRRAEDSTSGGDGPGAEADSFYCLLELLAELRDAFTRELDYSEGGVR